MNFLSLTGDNFMSLEHFNIELNNRGLIAIQGVNLADSSAVSNGAGKSSIPDAISWALFGVTARGSAGDRVINTRSRKDTQVKVTIDDDGTRYRIERYRKHEKFKNQCFLFQINPDGTELDLSKGTDRETQVEINRVIGADAEVFNAAIYAGQEALPNLPGMTDKALKSLLEEASGTSELAECYKVARAASLDAQKLVAVEQANLEGLKNGLTQAQNWLADAERQFGEFEDSRRERAKAELMPVVAYKTQIEETEAKISAIEVTNPQAEVEKAEAAIAAVAAEVAQAKKLDDARIDALNNFVKSDVSLKNLKKSIKAEVEAAKYDLEHVNDKLGQPCSSCGKLYCEEDLGQAKDLAQSRYDKAIARIKAEVVPHTAETAKLKEESEAAEAACEAYKATMTDVSGAYRARSNAVASINQIAAFKRDVDALKGKIETCNKAATGRLHEVNPHQAYVDRYKGDIETAEKSIKAQEEKISGAEDELQTLADVVEVFGPAGVRAHILDLVTPFLNDKTRDYLGALSDGNIHAVWSTLTKTAKGDLKEKFNIEVSNDKGGSSFVEMSGGEKRKTRLSTAMALQELVASRATKPINLFIADEIDDALDPAGLERLMGVLTQRAKDCGTVMIVSHNGLSDWVDSVITVTKDATGVSHVSGDTHNVM